MEEEILSELRKAQLAQVKTDILLDILGSIKEIEAVEKFDLEAKAIQKLSNLIDTI